MVEPAAPCTEEATAGDSQAEKLDGPAPLDQVTLQAESATEEAVVSDLTATEGVVITSEGTAAPTAETVAEPAAEVDEEKEVDGEDVSTALLEGSKMGRSVVSATGGETPLEYSTDFENSVGGAEVYKIHE
jgi:hypothetical protein